MLFSERSIWTMVHGIGLGGGALIGLAAALFYLYAARPAPLTTAGTEAESLQGEDVYIVGGANSAGQAAVHFAKSARKVTMLVRGSSLQKDMSQYLIDQINGTKNIEIRVRSSIAEVIGAVADALLRALRHRCI